MMCPHVRLHFYGNTGAVFGQISFLSDASTVPCVSAAPVQPGIKLNTFLKFNLTSNMEYNGNQGWKLKGLKMNTERRKVMFCCSMKDRVEEKGKWPCGVCKKGVNNNSILCHSCKKWIHKRCSGVKRSLHKARCKVDKLITDGLILTNCTTHLSKCNAVADSKDHAYT